jgi:hypothetical protein
MSSMDKNVDQQFSDAWRAPASLFDRAGQDRHWQPDELGDLPDLTRELSRERGRAQAIRPGLFLETVKP